MTAYVVTTSVRGTSRSQVWNTSSPLALGHPMHWVVEQTPTGVRIRKISSRLNEAQSGAFREIPFNEIESGNEIALDPKFTIRFRPVVEMPPAFADRSPDFSKDHGLTVYSCAGNWVMSSSPVENEFTATLPSAKDQPVFTLKKKGDDFELAIFGEGITVADRKTSPQERITLKSTDLPGTMVSLGTYAWHFNIVQNPGVLSQGTKKQLDSETVWFRKSLAGAAVALGLFSLMTWLWPKPEVTELVPPQVAKLIMTKPAQQAAAPSASEDGEKIASKEVVQKKVQNTAVVQAFRAKALQNSINGLLKGGMTRLLAQSEFVSGAKASADARRIFDSRSNSLRATASDIGQMTKKNVTVASIGGGGAKGVGYSKGQRASVSGQGTSHVALDISASSVEEGLTKDEVGEVIHRHLSEVRYCYEAAMLRTPGIEGKLLINFTIGGSGMVKSSEIKTSTLPDPRLDDCVLRRLVTWKFPNTKGGIDVAVSYPFIFKTLGR